MALQYGPPGWESIPGILKRITNTGSQLPFDFRAHSFQLLSQWIMPVLNHYAIKTTGTLIVIKMAKTRIGKKGITLFLV